MTSLALNEAKDVLGELLIAGISGLELDYSTETFLNQSRIGGVILFSPNYQSPGQVAELINHVQSCRVGLPMWISVDHEGGKVQRFKKPFTKIPEAAAIAATGSPKIAFEIGELIAKELKAVGVNVNYAPVADINTNPKNPVIGARSYGDNEDLVSKMVTAVLRGHLTQGVLGCVKHFPGHGDTSTDSHFALPKVTTPLETLLEREIRPFVKAFKSRCPMVMTAHILNPALDPDFPATLSAKTIKGILRGELRYTKLILSDDMEMKAIVDNFGADEAPRLALQAGCDLLIYRSEAAARHAYAALTRALEDGKLAPEIVLEAAARSREVKKEYLGTECPPVVISDIEKKIGTPENLAFVSKI
ncbi:MAG: beta-N-acetylhexosaminidase [Bdellovibrionota bacterium]